MYYFSLYNNFTVVKMFFKKKFVTVIYYNFPYLFEIVLNQLFFKYIYLHEYTNLSIHLYGRQLLPEPSIYLLQIGQLFARLQHAITFGSLCF